MARIHSAFGHVSGMNLAGSPLSDPMNTPRNTIILPAAATATATLALLLGMNLLGWQAMRFSALALQWTALFLFLPAGGRWLRSRKSLPRGRFAALAALALLFAATLLAPALRPVLRPPQGLPLVPLAPAVAAALALLVRKTSLGSRVMTSLDNRHQLLPYLLPGLALTLAATLPEVITFWDASGWKDSINYDAAAHAIATGTDLWGNSYYMPLYQYGMGLLYYLFGHQFWVQQCANILMACATAMLLPLAAWNLFRSKQAVLAAGFWAAFTWQLHHAPMRIQIENWYVPAMCLVLWSWTRYRTKPTTTWTLLLGAALGVAINIRSQGAFCIAALCLAPLFVQALPRRKALAQVVLLGCVVAVSLLPWSFRNLHVSGRFSPTSEQASLQLAVLNDPRAAFYGIRYDVNYSALVGEYLAKYPDKSEREQALRSAIGKNLFKNPIEMIKATYWRTLAYYGLLPPGVWSPGGPQPTDWTPGLAVRWAYSSLPAVLALCAALAGVVFAPGRTTLFLLLAMLGNWVLVVMVGSGEARISYPALPMHALIGLHAGFAAVRQTSPAPKRWYIHWKKAAGLAALLLFLGVLARLGMGEPNACRTLAEPRLAIAELQSHETDRLADVPRAEGETVRFMATVSANMHPPKYMQGMQEPDIPAYALALDKPQFYVLNDTTGMAAAVSYAGAQADMPLKEGDRVAITGTVLDLFPEDAPNIMWVQAGTVEVLARNCPPTTGAATP